MRIDWAAALTRLVTALVIAALFMLKRLKHAGAPADLARAPSVPREPSRVEPGLEHTEPSPARQDPTA